MRISNDGAELSVEDAIKAMETALLEFDTVVTRAREAWSDDELVRAEGVAAEEQRQAIEFIEESTIAVLLTDANARIAASSANPLSLYGPQQETLLEYINNLEELLSYDERPNVCLRMLKSDGQTNEGATDNGWTAVLTPLSSALARLERGAAEGCSWHDAPTEELQPLRLPYAAEGGAVAEIATLLHDVLQAERPSLLGVDEVQSAQLELLRRRAAGGGADSTEAEAAGKEKRDAPTEQGDYVLALLLRMLHLNLRLAAATDRSLCAADAAAIPALSAQLTRLVSAASSSSSSAASQAQQGEAEQETGLEQVGVAAAQAYGVGIRYFLVEPRSRLEAAASYLQLVSEGCSSSEKQVASLVLANVSDAATLASLVGKTATEAAWAAILAGTATYALAEYTSWAALSDSEMAAVAKADGEQSSTTQMAEASWWWSADKTDRGCMSLSNGGLVVKKTSNNNDYSITCGDEGWDRGMHVWTVQIVGDMSGVWAGCCTRPSNYGRRISNRGDAGCDAWFWKPSGKPGGHINGHSISVEDSSSAGYQAGQTLRFTLDLDAGTVAMAVMQTGTQVVAREMGSMMVSSTLKGAIFPCVCFDYTTSAVLLSRQDQLKVSRPASLSLRSVGVRHI